MNKKLIVSLLASLFFLNGCSHLECEIKTDQASAGNVSATPAPDKGTTHDKAPRPPVAVNHQQDDKAPRPPVTVNNPQDDKASRPPVAVNNPQDDKAPRPPVAVNNPQDDKAPKPPVAVNNPQDDKAPKPPVAVNNPQDDKAPKTSTKNQTGSAPETSWIVIIDSMSVPLPQKAKQPSSVNKYETFFENAGILHVKPFGKGTEHSFATDLMTKMTSTLKDVFIFTGEEDLFDLQLQLHPSFTKVDVAGDFVRMDCKVSVSIGTRKGNILLASEIFDFKSKERQLGMENAKKQFLSISSRKIGEWLARRFAEIGVENVYFRIKLPPRKKHSKPFSNELAHIENVIKSLPGVIDYQCIGFDEGDGTCSYRIIYAKNKIQGGLAEQLAKVFNGIQH